MISYNTSMETSYDTPSGVRSAPGDPSQGEWTEGRYLALPTPHRFELADGRLEVLPLSSWFDTLISEYVYERLKEYLKQNPVGRIVPSPILVRLWHGQIRLPDLTLVFNARLAADRKKAQDGADFVVEVVSGDEEDRRRDLVEKRAVYAKAGIAEYWIVDPETPRSPSSRWRAMSTGKRANSATVLRPVQFCSRPFRST